MPFQPIKLYGSSRSTQCTSSAKYSTDFYSILIAKQKDINKKVTEHGLKSEDQELKAQAEIQKRQQEVRKANELRERKEEEDKRWQNLCKELGQFMRTRQRKQVEDNDDHYYQDDLDSLLESMSVRRFDPSRRSEYIMRFQDAVVQTASYTIFYCDLEAIVQVIQRYGYAGSNSITLTIQSSRQLEQSIRDSITAVRAAKKREQASFRPQLEQFFSHPLLPRLSNSVVRDLEDAYESTSQKRILGSGSATGSIFVQVFPYIARQKQAFDQLDNDGKASYSADEAAAVRNIVSVIQQPTQFITQLSPSSTGGTVKISIAQMVTLAQEIAGQLNVFPRNSPNIASAVQEIHETIVVKVQRDNKDRSIDSSNLYAILICAIYRALSISHKKTWSSVLQSYFHALPIVIPDISDQSVSIDDQLATLRLYASIVAYQIPSSDVSNSAVGTSSAVSPLPISLAWRWLQRLTQQLYVLLCQRRNVNGDTNSTGTAVAFELDVLPTTNIALLLNSFLMRTAYSLSMAYPEQFLQLMRTWQQEFFGTSSTTANASNQLLLKGFDDVKSRILAIINKQGVATPVYYLHQDPCILDALFYQQQHIVTLEQEMLQLEIDRSGPFMQRVKSLQIDRMRAIFNRMGATEESRETNIKQLLERVVLASKDSSEMLRYTLFKIVQHITTDCQADSFNEMEESHPLKLARVICSIGKQISQLAEIFRADFLRTCPLLIPRLLPEGIDEQAGFLSLGFTINKSNNTLEKNEKWLARMSKLLTTAVVIAIQPEQIVFTIDTLWLLLARVTNIMARVNNPPYFVPTIYEVLLRISGKLLHDKYKQSFIQLLTIIQTQVMPKITDANIPKRQNVNIFLDRFIKSNGQDFLGFFSQRQDLIHDGGGNGGVEYEGHY